VFCYVLPNWQNKGDEKDNDNDMTHTQKCMLMTHAHQAARHTQLDDSIYQTA